MFWFIFALQLLQAYVIYIGQATAWTAFWVIGNTVILLLLANKACT